MKKIKEQLEKMGYDYAVAIATQSEIENGAACGQLAIISDWLNFYILCLWSSIMSKELFLTNIELWREKK